jgi:hypothetical protein
VSSARLREIVELPRVAGGRRLARRVAPLDVLADELERLDRRRQVHVAREQVGDLDVRELRPDGDLDRQALLRPRRLEQVGVERARERVQLVDERHVFTAK